MKKISLPFACAALLLASPVMLMSGCACTPGRAAQVAYAENAGSAALESYDTNGDGAIGDAELAAVPALKAGIGQADADGDGKLTSLEIDTRVQSWRDSRVAEMPVMCEVSQNGSPLAGAQIELEPEAFLGSSLPPASGTTDSNGMASLSMAKQHLADPQYDGVVCGWYKVRITSDQSAIPAKYNTETTLGCEIAVDAHWISKDRLVFELKAN